MRPKKLSPEERAEQKRKEAEDKAAKRIEAEENAKNKKTIAEQNAEKEKRELAKAEKELKATLSVTLFAPKGDKPRPVLGETARDKQEGHYPSRVGSKNPSVAPSASTTPLPSVPNTPRL